jgi:anti-sigma-K factor RskA
VTLFTDHHHTEDLLGAYSLDAVDDDERFEVELHLDECPRCRQEVDAYREIAAALGHTVDEVPEDLWERIAEDLVPGPQRQPSLTLLRTPDRKSSSPRASVTNPPRWRTAWAAAAVAGVAAACVLGAFLAHTNSELTGSRQALGSTSQAAEHALTVKGHHVIQLDSASGTNLAEVVLVPGGKGYVLSHQMQSLSDGHTYQLWAIENGTPISLGLLGSHPGAAAFSLGAAKPSALALSVEPAGGSVAPTTTPVATGAI